MVTPDLRHIISGSADETIRAWNLATGEQCKILHCLDQSIFSLILMRDQKTLISSSHQGNISMWKLDLGAQPRQRSREPGHAQAGREMGSESTANQDGQFTHARLEESKDLGVQALVSPKPESSDCFSEESSKSTPSRTDANRGFYQLISL